MANSIADSLISVTLTGLKDVRFQGARIREGINRIAEAEIELSTTDVDAKLEKLIGAEIALAYSGEGSSSFSYKGICISVAEHRRVGKARLFIVQCRSWLWLLTQRRNSRVFAGKAVQDIFKEIAGEFGFSGEVSGSATAVANPLDKYVQYDESDFVFVSRLMEQFGVNYLCQNEKVELTTLASPTDKKEIEFVDRDAEEWRPSKHVYGVELGNQLTQNKVTLHDFNFMTPSKTQTTLNASKASTLSENTTSSTKNWPAEEYVFPGGFREDTEGDKILASRNAAIALGQAVSHARSNFADLRAGVSFKLKDHPNSSANQAYLITESELRVKGPEKWLDSDFDDDFMITDATEGEDIFRVAFAMIPKPTEVAPAQITPRPKIYGVQTAMVVGDGGEGQIESDLHGRVKIRFHWDRGDDDKSHYFWVRCAQPWTGKNWGMYAIPRIGQEVLIQFEHGDPDRPICVGMLYNDLFRPPYDLPANQTQTGIVTRTLDGSATTFNELIFEDKKDQEFVRLQSEKDFNQIVKNNATITVGLEKRDPGDLKTTVHNDVVEDVGNDYTQTVKNNIVESAGMNITIDAGSKIAVSAKTEIKLTVGANSITISQSGIAIEGTTVTVKGTATLDASSPSTTVSGDAMLTLKGGVVMIN